MVGTVPARRADMKFVYEVGMRIRGRDRKEEKGEVTEVESDDEVRVLWDYDKGQGPRWCETRDIIPDSPEAEQLLAENTKQVQAKIDEATTLLEQAFKAWFEAVSLQAGREVGNSEAYYLRGNPDLDLSKFEGVVESNGWSTSSLYC